jgi:4'-phosphopantetheinyl transferase
MSVAVHLVDLDLPGDELEALSVHLDPAERRRAAALRDPRDRARFCACHGWLRVALARELGVAPSEVPLVAPTDHKPWVERSALCFSASRSGASALLAVSWSGEVGVDVEEVRDGADPLRFAARWYTPAERASVEKTPVELRNRRCLEIWTRKEAYLKATGSGLTVSPASVEVAPAGPGPARIGDWVVHQLAAGSGIAAAVALRCRPAGDGPAPSDPPVVCSLHLDGTPGPLLDRGSSDNAPAPTPSPGSSRSTQLSAVELSPGLSAATKPRSSPML